MKLILLFSVIFGVAFGKKLECLNKEITACVQKLDIASLAKDENKCAQLEAVMGCFESSSKLCKDDAPKAVENLVAIGRDICKPDSQTMKDLIQHGQCLQKPDFMVNYIPACLGEDLQGFKDLGTPDVSNIEAYQDKVMKFFCPKREKLVDCSYGQIKTQCGADAEKFFRKLVDPLNELTKESCGDSASIPSISMALICLQLLFAIFSFRKMF